MKTNLGFLLASLLAAAPAWAGPLTPPGAPAPTMKTLDEVEARTPIHADDIPLAISEPGSYYLAENINYSGAENGITIAAANVTIDLNGFTLKGPGSGGAIDGIRSQSDETTGTIIKNGTVSDWPQRGISLFSHSCHVENVNVRQNGDRGLQIRNGSIIDCTAEFNGADGITCFGTASDIQSIVSGCKSSNNGNNGIQMEAVGLIMNNTCSANENHGIGISGSNCVANNNICSQNGSNGINVFSADNAGINDNNCSANDGTGIRITFSEKGTIKQNNCSDNGLNGIEVSSFGCRIESNNVISNDNFGLIVSNASIVLKNTSSQNVTGNYSFSASACRADVILLNNGDFASDQPWANFEF